MFTIQPNVIERQPDSSLEEVLAVVISWRCCPP